MFAAISGLIAGTIHVWSGPDHLAAIAPLAARTRRASAWVSGAKWGLGHSAGVAVVGLLSLWLREYLPVDLLSTWGERMVGVMLVGIGIWAIRKVFMIHAHEHQHENARHLHFHAHRRTFSHDKHEAHQHHTHAAFGIGVLHGLAGSSHFLGVLPALAFPTRSQALSYLLAFGAGTIASMAAFSTTIGWLASRCSTASTSVYRGLMSLCAAGAIGVGIFWMVHS